MGKIKDILIATIGATDMAVGGYSMTTIDTPVWVGWFFVWSGIIIVFLIWAPLAANVGVRFISERALLAPRWPQIQKWFNWRVCKPHIGGSLTGHNYSIKDEKVVVCDIFYPFTLLSNFYYGDTVLITDNIKMTVKQNKGGKDFFYNFKLKPSTGPEPIPIGPAGWENGELIFEWDKIGSEERFAPSLDFEFSWTIEGIKAKLIGPEGEMVGKIPAIKGTNLGRRI